MDWQARWYVLKKLGLKIAVSDIAIGTNNLPISVVVIAKNAQDDIGDCLKAISENRPAEIIVVDGKSTDQTVEIARRYTERIYSDEGKGQAYARQLGAEKATQEYLAYVDADVILTDGALETMLNELIRSDYVSINAQISPEHDGFNYWEWAQWWQHCYSAQRVRNNHFATMACLLKREIVLKYRFDLTGGHLDDISLEYKLKAAGYKLGTSSAAFCHRWIRSFGGVMSHRFLIGRNGAHAMKKYGPWHAGYWAPLASTYWLAMCIRKGNLKLIPFVIVDGIAELAGMLAGFVDIVKGKSP
jgi:glycosyltransferase involved in cell wall biosynthesis